MQFEGAIVKEQNVTFAIAVVKRHVLNSSHVAQRTAQSFASVFPGMPVVLMAQDYRGTPTYFGRKDIVKFLSGVPMQAIPWKRYTVG